MERWLCREYGCLPTDLDEQDVGRLMRGLEAESIHGAAGKPHTKWTKADQAVMIPVLELDVKRQNESTN
jgi:hypothetical protein